MWIKTREWKSGTGRIVAGAALGLYGLLGGWGETLVWAKDLACVMKPFLEVSVGPPVEGIIQAVHVERGDWVSQGQIIVTLEASVEEAAVALAKAKAEAEATIKSTQAKVAFSTRKLERAMDLHKSNSIAKHEVDEAQTEKILAEMAHQEAVENKQVAELEWKRATAALNLHRIRSPLSGMVVERLLSPGELARQTPILKLAQIDPLRVEVFAPLSWLGKLQFGMKGEVRPEGSETTYEAKVTVVNRVADSASGTFGVRLEMPNPNNALPSGLGCTVDFHQRP
ncbi:MAG: efflux RND transporter periplasmic adaptor subunit [Nitrospira sp.]|nr:efflux RND transporter periplasmic adaptor subunit [Nitrospira sp.]